MRQNLPIIYYHILVAYSLDATSQCEDQIMATFAACPRVRKEGEDMLACASVHHQAKHLPSLPCR
jgi:hypothetical protein